MMVIREWGSMITFRKSTTMIMDILRMHVITLAHQ